MLTIVVRMIKIIEAFNRMNYLLFPGEMKANGYFVSSGSKLI